VPPGVPLLDLSRARHLQAPVRRVFPESALVPETQLHLELRTILYQLLKDFLGDAATVSCDQFVYWAADDPAEVLAPDAAVRRTPAGGLLRSWKTWERGAPEVAVEIVSDSDAGIPAWQEKLRRYDRMGVLELVRFDPQTTGAERLRIWDRVDGDLVERLVEGNAAPSSVLPCAWEVAGADDLPVALRLRDGLSGELIPTRAEARLREVEARRQEAEARRQEAEARRREAEARHAAEARVLELEAELERHRRG
jgi:Uma2 family endonuclease